MVGKSQKPLRCAIYTRKSTEHGLELEFNSLDAQRDACEAYVKSQASEGWRALPKRYDDPAYSGGNLDRPALQSLLEDIEVGQVDVVVVYKIDRLTRSLTDFAKLVEIFDAKAVSFVAITQQFNTTTSMGRLTLNILLSFAQFERELASERVRDKVVASRRKGKWTGGSVPLGYDSKDKRLVVNADEAKMVRTIFETYLRLGSFQKLIDDLDAKGIVTKKRSVAGRIVGGIPFSYGPLAYLLKNRTYIGETGHNGSWFPGEHEAIIDCDTFEKVQQLIKSNSAGRTGRRQRTGALLTGRIYDDRGNRMSPSFSVKNGVRYPFYVSTALLKGRKSEAGSVPRVSAAEIEAAVLKAVGPTLDDTTQSTAISPRDLVEQKVSRIVLGHRRLVITLKVTDEISPEPIELPWSVDRTRNLVVIENCNTNVRQQSANLMLVQAIVRAHTWLKLLSDGTYDSVDALARNVELHPKVIRKAIRMAFIAPAITKAVLRGDHHQKFRLGDLDEVSALNWTEQTATQSVPLGDADIS